MANDKASNNLHICVELLKWTDDRARAWLSHILTHASQHGFTTYWQDNWVQPFFKGGDFNVVPNYRTIMVSTTLAKLVSIVLETKISTWAEEAHKRAIGQVGFQKEHCTVDHSL